MKLSNPFQISARLLPALHVGNAWVQLEILPARSDDGRIVYRWTIDLPDGSEHTGSDLKSGCFERGTHASLLQSGFGSLLSFLTAAAESWSYVASDGGRGENADLFPPAVCEWAAENSDELSMLGIEIEETAGLLAE